MVIIWFKVIDKHREWSWMVIEVYSVNFPDDVSVASKCITLKKLSIDQFLFLLIGKGLLLLLWG